MIYLNAHWQSLPPIAIQLRRIVSWLGIEQQTTAPPENHEPASLEAAAAELEQIKDRFPMGTLPKVIRPDEYLKRKKEIYGH